MYFNFIDLIVAISLKILRRNVNDHVVFLIVCLSFAHKCFLEFKRFLEFKPVFKIT